MTDNLIEKVHPITGEVFVEYKGELNAHNKRLSKRGREVLSQKPALIPLTNKKPETMREKWARFHLGRQYMQQQGLLAISKGQFFETEEEFNDFDMEDNPYENGNVMAEDYDRLSEAAGKAASSKLTEEARAVAASRPENFPADALKEEEASKPTSLQLTPLEEQIIASYRNATKSTSSDK